MNKDFKNIFDIVGNLNENCGHPDLLVRRVTKVARKVELK